MNQHSGNLGIFGLLCLVVIFVILRNFFPSFAKLLLIFGGIAAAGVAVLIALGLWKFESVMVKGFTVFGKLIVAVITVGLISGIAETLTGIVIIPGMNPISEGFEIVADIAIVLAGAFPLVLVITKIFKKPLMKLGKLVGMNDVAAAGIVASLANSIPMFQMVKDMDPKGKIVNFAFAVSAAFVFGDHLGFTAGFDSTMIVPMIIGKLVSGISAVVLAVFIANKTLGEKK